MSDTPNPLPDRILDALAAEADRLRANWMGKAELVRRGYLPAVKESERA